MLPLLLIISIYSSSFICSVDATKNKFVTIRDHRTFIGPIGAPFGFLADGEYSLSVTNFGLKLKDHHRKKKYATGKSKQKADDDSMQEYLKELHPGFLLKRFKNENDFAYFQDEIYDNVTKCGFEEFIRDGEFAEDNDDSIGLDFPGKEVKTVDYYNTKFDDRAAKGKGVIDGGAKGIFLSMKNQENMWFPRTPSLYHNFTVDEEGYYFLFYQVCLPPINASSSANDMSKYIFKEITSNFKLEFNYMNRDALGKVSYLTAGEMPLPHIYLYFTISYIIMLIIWLQSFKGDISNASSGNGDGIARKPTIYAIHHLMSSVVFLKMMTMLLESVRYHYIRVNGNAKVWSFVYFLTNFFKGTFLFIVILLIGSGWSFFKPFLSVKERRVVLFVIGLQIIDNIAIAFLSYETENERIYNDWSTVLHLVDIISCCAILLPIVWQVNTLEESVDVGTESADRDDNNGNNVGEESSSTTRLQSKLDLFRSFYLIVVAYIYFSRILIYLFSSSLDYHQTWIKYFVYELGTMAFYFSIGVKFKPVVENQSYSQLDTLPDDDDVEDLQVGQPQQKVDGIEMPSLMGTKVGKD